MAARRAVLRPLRGLLAAAAVLALAGSPPAAAGVDRPVHWGPEQACPDVFVVGVRGSGEARRSGGADPERGFGHRAVVVLDRVVGALAPAGIRVAPVSVDYPALGLADAALSVLDARAAGFGASIEAGVDDLVEVVAGIRGACPAAVHVLVGYSQGAEVIRRAVGSGGIGDGDDLAAVVLISDLRFDPGDADHGVALRGTYDPQRRGVRHSLSALPPAPGIAGRTVSVCNRRDIGCQFSRAGLPVALLDWPTARDVHLAYGPADLAPVVRGDVLPLVRERLDVASWRRFVLLPL